MNEELFTSDVIYVAAADSTEKDKALANYICTGVNDQDVIQEAVDTIATPKCGEIRGIRIIVLSGNYYISDFPRRNGNGRVAVMTGIETNKYEHIGIVICGSEYTQSTIIHVTQECYDSVDPDESCSIFASADENWNQHIFKDLYITVPDDQKNIICIDGRFMGSLNLRRCKCLCDSQGSYLTPKKALPVEGFVGFMGNYGSKNMWENKWESCMADGFGQGFALGGEHLVLIKCAARFGRYGYTFNNYPLRVGIVGHPMTLFNCIDEANGNMWKFAKNNNRQCVNAYNTSFETFPEWLALEGHYSYEENPGDYCGHIDYVPNHGCDSSNCVDVPFWEKGSGIGFNTVNNVHRKVITSAERRTYSANIGQEVFDIDLGKKVIYTGSNWYDLMGNLVD